MYCAKCGNFIPDGQVCSCELDMTMAVGNQQQPQTTAYDNQYQSQIPNYGGQGDYYRGVSAVGNSSKLKLVTKIVGFVLVIAAFLFHFMDVFTTSRDFDVSQREYENYNEDVSDAAKDYENGKISIESGMYSYSDESNPLEKNGRGYISYSYLLLIFTSVSFALYIGALMASRNNKKADNLRLIAQSLFFVLLLVSFLFAAFFVSSLDNDYGYYEDDPYVYQYSLSIGWWLTVTVSVLGLAVSAVSAFLDRQNKEV